MSRSYKKFPLYKDNGGGKKGQRPYLKIMRTRLKDINYQVANGGAYKRVINSYNLSDYWFYAPWDKKLIRNLERCANPWKHWFKYYRQK